MIEGDRVMLTAKGVKWSTTKMSKTIGIDWNKRVGVIERNSIVNKSVTYVKWDGLGTAREFPKCFLRVVNDERSNQATTRDAAPAADQGC